MISSAVTRELLPTLSTMPIGGMMMPPGGCCAPGLGGATSPVRVNSACTRPNAHSKPRGCYGDAVVYGCWRSAKKTPAVFTSPALEVITKLRQMSHQ